MTESRSHALPSGINDQARRLAARVDSEFGPVVAAREELRARLVDSGEIISFTDTPTVMPDSMCAIDGARVKEQMYAADLLVAAAFVADARATTTRHTVEPSLWSDVVRHMDGTDRLAEAAMGAQEVRLAATAPHALRILDGSLATPLIALREGLFVKQPSVRDAVADLLLDKFDAPGHLARLLDGAPGAVLALAKSDSSAKFVSDYATRFGINFPINDRFLATQILEPGEMLRPRAASELIYQKVNEPEGSAKVKRAAADLRTQYDRIAALATAGHIRTTYFKPHVPGAGGIAARTVARFEYIVTGDTQAADTSIPANYAGILNADMVPPHILEPYCQYMVDKEAKQISTITRMLREGMIAGLPADRSASYKALLASNYRT